MIFRLTERDLQTKYGIFREILFYDGQKESVALVMGNVENGEDIICRVHSACVSGHVFNSVECECQAEMETAQSAIQKAGKGVIIYLEQEGKGNGHLALMASIPYKKAGMKQPEAYEKAGFEKDARSFRPAAEILQDLKIKSIVLLRENAKEADDLLKCSINKSVAKELKL